MSRLLVIGGDAAGMSTASTANGLIDDLEIVVLERGRDTSYSACGVPYWIAGDIESDDDLVARSPQEHRERGIDVRLGCEATSIDADAQTVEYTDAEGSHTIAYDRLVLGFGAASIVPPWDGVDADGIHQVKDLRDGRRIIEHLDRGVSHAVIVGSGYIGIEMAEALTARDIDVTVIERAETPLPIVEDEIGEIIAKALAEHCATMVTGAEVTGFETADGVVTGVVTDERTYPADLVIAALGVSPRQELWSGDGPKGAIVTDTQQRVIGVENVWAAGDCVAVTDRITGDLLHLPLGTHANRQGMVAGESIAASLGATWTGRTFPGVVQTAITKFCDLEIARVGLSRAAAADAGLQTVSATIETTTTAGYWPGSEALTVWGIADRVSRRLLGVQVAGGAGAGLRIDGAALAIWNSMSVDDLVFADMAYAPPFSSVWSPIQVLARKLVKTIDAG